MLPVLVLTRKKGQSLMIGQNIEISIVDIQGDQVRIGINAPREVSIHRKEVFDEIRKENLAATSHVPDKQALQTAFTELKEMKEK